MDAPDMEFGRGQKTFINHTEDYWMECPSYAELPMCKWLEDNVVTRRWIFQKLDQKFVRS